MLPAVTPLLTLALLGVLAASASASAAVVLVEGTSTTTRAASDSVARAKAKASATTTTTKSTAAAKPTTSKPAATTNAGTSTGNPSETRTTLTRPTVATATRKPGTPATSPARTSTAQTTTNSRPGPTVARVAPAPAGAPAAGKPAGSATVARVGPPRPAPNTTANAQAKTAPARAGAAVAKVTAGGVAGTALTTPASNAGGKGSVTPIARSSANPATPGGTTVSKAAAPKPAGRKATGALAMAVPLDEHQTYQYNALGRRDVFQSLMDGEFVGVDVGGNAPPDVGGVKVVGIVWGSDDQFAMVEDARGDSYILRRGDKVMNGFVEGLKRDAMIINMTVDGQSQSITIPVTRKGGEKSNANR